MKKVIWSEGMMLTQQHFQQWEKHFYENRNNMECGIPDNWGVVHMKIDRVQITRSHFVLREGHFIFPENEWIKIHRQASLEYDLSQCHESKIQLYLCLPLSQNIKGINGYDEQPGDVGWEANYCQTQDQHDPSRQQEVLFATRKVFLASQYQLSSNYQTLKIAECYKNSDGQWKIAPYIPPIVFLSASYPCLLILKDLIEKINCKKEIIKDNILKLVLYESAQQLENCRQYHTHPRMLYYALTLIICKLSALLKDYTPAQLPQYDHQHLNMVITGLVGNVKDILQKINRLGSTRIAFEAIGKGLYCNNSLSESHLKNKNWKIIIEDSVLGEYSNDWLVSQIKIGSKTHINMCLSAALSGIPCEIISKTSKRAILKINTTDESWQRVMSERNLAIALSPPLNQCQLYGEVGEE